MRTLIGKIVSTKMNETVVVEVVRFVEHHLYKKRMRRTNKFHAAVQPKQQLVTGDTVKIAETAPVSKTKNWVVIEKVKEHVAT